MELNAIADVDRGILFELGRQIGMGIAAGLAPMRGTKAVARANRPRMAIQTPPAPAKRACGKPNCNRQHLARGLCGPHYDQARRDRAKAKICTVFSCGKPARSGGLCATHYQQRARLRRAKVKAQKRKVL